MDGKKKQIRVAILCHGTIFDQWEAECIREVLSLPFVDIVLLVAEPEEKSSTPDFFGKLFSYPYRNFLWRYFRRFRLKINSFRKESLKKELEGVPLIYSKPELKGKYSQHFSSDDIATIKSHHPDVILRFAYNILRGEILKAATYGVWSFHHADEQTIRGGPAAFWEIYNRVPVTGAILQRLTDKLDGGIILRKGFFPTLKRSYKANLEQLIRGTTPWMKQVLIDISNDLPFPDKEVKSAARIFTVPKNFQMIRAWRICTAYKLKFHWHELFCPDQWNVGIVNKSISEIVANGIPDEIEWHPEPVINEYYADPFGWEENDELKIVFEHYDYKKKKGILSVSNQNGEVKPLLEAKVHLSYPFVLERTDRIENNRVILPESYQSKTVFCFDSADPKIGRILMENIQAIDSTPIFHNDKWWMFCTIEGDFNNTNLHIFHAKDFDGPWLPHANNPVKSDIRSSRPGGTPFLLNKKLYRPAQDCSTTYGAAIVINEITDLSEISFSEKTISRIEPHKKWKFNKGLHTLSIAGNFILIDAKRYAFNFDNFRHNFKRKLTRLFR
jgi:hypothetical protein